MEFRHGTYSHCEAPVNGILIAAGITTLLAIATWGTLLRQLSDPADRRVLLLLAIVAAPLSLGAFYLVRLPLDSFLEPALANWPQLYTAVRLCYAPLTEEPAKLLPLFLLLLPALRRPITRHHVVPIALALGLGFGIGEIWLVANLVRQDEKLAGLPFYMFGGFLGERLIVCITHAGFTVLAVWALCRGWLWFPLGLLGGMVSHFLANFPIYLKHRDVASLGPATWDVLILVWLAMYFVGTLVVLCVLHFGLSDLRRLVLGKARCPSCGEVYARPLLMGLNAGMKRYERCPACRKWHWIDARDNVV